VSREITGTSMAEPLQHRIMQNGSGWYWEVVTAEGEVISRFVADTYDQAREDAEQ